MKLRKNKKGFTIIELVIVIAVIGVLTAILVPVFLNLTQKANEASDQTLVATLNKILAIAEVEEGYEKSENPTDMFGVLEQKGYIGETLIRDQKSDKKILYNLPKNRFLFEENKGSADFSGSGPHDFWTFSRSLDTTGYSTYLFKEFNGPAELEPIAGLDVGKNDEVTLVNYSHTGDRRDVVIRTNSYLTTLKVNAPSEVVHHYDKAGIVNIISSDTASYHENGTVPFLEVAGGHVVLESKSNVSSIHFTATGEGSAAKFENEDGKTISLDLSKVAEDKVPKFSRDNVEIAEQGTFVAKVTSETDEYIWLWGNGTQTEMVVATTATEIAESDGHGGYQLVAAVEAGTENGTIADQIANKAVYNPLSDTTTYEVKTTKEEAMEVLEDAYTEAMTEVTKDDGQQRYAARIGSTGYETFAAAVNAANNMTGSTIVILQDIPGQTFTWNVTYPSTLDLNGYKITLSNRGNITVKNGSSILIKNGDYDSSKILATEPNCSVTFDKVNVIKRVSGVLFQIYNKANIDFNFNDSSVSLATVPTTNLQNSALLSIAGNSSANVCCNFVNTDFSWSANVPLILFSTTNEAVINSCEITFDKASYNSVSSEICYHSNASYGTGTTINENEVVCKLKQLTYWRNVVTSQPAGYVVDGDTITISSAEGLAYLAKQSQNDTFAGKTIELTNNLDMSNNLWEPIGDKDHTFAGTFDGKGYTISGLSSIVHGPNADLYTYGGGKYGNGLFHRVSGTVQNLKIENANITDAGSIGVNISGVVAGYSAGGTFSNITIINSTVSGFGKVGGILGMAESGSTTLNNIKIDGLGLSGNYNLAYLVGLVVSNDSNAVSVTGTLNIDNANHHFNYTSRPTVEVNEGKYVGAYFCENEDNTDYLFCKFATYYTVHVDDNFPIIIDGKDYVITSGEYPVNELA